MAYRSNRVASVVRPFTASVLTGSRHVHRLLRTGPGPRAGEVEGPVGRLTIDLGVSRRAGRR